ncbi:MAG: hypothetical protein NTX03_01175 [Bacteroidetes bacterium]|nr:hypothetical protein [Bacteroidota bacterium]
MNFKVLLLLFCTQIFVINSIKACTMCGSAASNTFTGSLQSFDKNFIGTRYNYRQFSIFKEGSILKEEADENIPGYLSTQEIFAGFYPIKKLQIFAILPYHFYNSKDIHQSGLGDATLLANYNLFSLTAKNNCCIKYSLNLGAGLKLPTGKVKNDNTSVNSLQLVSGSLDYLFLTSFKMSYDKFTLVADGQYALTSPDKNNYRFGDRMATAINIFYNYSPTNELNIFPHRYIKKVLVEI